MNDLADRSYYGVYRMRLHTDQTPFLVLVPVRSIVVSCTVSIGTCVLLTKIKEVLIDSQTRKEYIAKGTIIKYNFSIVVHKITSFKRWGSSLIFKCRKC